MSAAQLRNSESEVNALRGQLREVVTAWIDDTHESAVDVINVLIGMVVDISDNYFGSAITPMMFESFAQTAKQRLD